MIDLSVIRDIVAIMSFVIGLSYYIITVQNQNRARKAQVLLSIQNSYHNMDAMSKTYETYTWEWDDYDDFEEKYGSDNNPQAMLMRITDWYWYNNVGLMLKNRLIDEEMTYDSMGADIITYWERWESIIREQRSRYFTDEYMEFMEYLAKRMKKVRNKRK